MEEAVGKLWHRFISSKAYQGYPDARVELTEVQRSLSVFFRAMGGDSALRVTATNAQNIQAKRGWLQKIAGSGKRMELAWRDHSTLMLPAQLDHFPSQRLNRDLYFWLAALAAVDNNEVESSGVQNYFSINLRNCLTVFSRYPGMTERYYCLLRNHLRSRPSIESLPRALRESETELRQLLNYPDSFEKVPENMDQLAMIPLWLYPQQSAAEEASGQDSESEPTGDNDRAKVKRADKRKHQAKMQEEEEDGISSLISIRHETDLFSLSEMLKIARPPEDDDELDDSEAMADDLEYLSISRDQRTRASRVRFDLDLPSAESDEMELGDGRLFKEWDYRKASYRENYCRVIPVLNTKANAGELPSHLEKTSRRIKQLMQSIINQRYWVRAQEEGTELDMEAVVQGFADQLRPEHDINTRIFKQMQRQHRELSTLVLADLSLSTEAGIDEDQKVIDIIRDGLFLFSECLQHIGDRFALYGFSSRRRDKVRFHTLKGFNEPYDSRVKGHLAAIRPGYYTRMGAAIRQASEILGRESCRQKLLLIISDGKPNDLDQYEGRYGIEDTRKAVQEAKQLGLVPFCITIDQDAEAYLPYLFGSNGFQCVQKLEQLPQALPELYIQLTQC